MKTIILLLSGLFDRPEPLSSAVTPLSQANASTLKTLAQHSQTGLLQTVPTHFSPVADAGALSLLGLRPVRGKTHRAGFELAGSGLTMKKDDAVMFCRLVSLSDDPCFEQRILLSDTLELSDTEEKQLWDFLHRSLNSTVFELRTAASGKTFLLWHKGEPAPGHFSLPEAALNRPIGDFLPQGDFTPPLVLWMEQCASLLPKHPLYKKLQSSGKPVPNAVWLWGASEKPCVESFSERFSVKASALSTDDYFSGIARAGGLNVQHIEASLNPEILSAQASQLLRTLSKSDCVYFYHHALARCNSFEKKVTAIETVDRYFLEPLVCGIKSQKEPFRLLLTADHVVPAALGIPTLEAVPYLLFQSSLPYENSLPFCESLPTDNFISDPAELLSTLITASSPPKR